MIVAHIHQITGGYKLSLQHLWIYYSNFVEYAVELRQTFVEGKFYLLSAKQLQYLGGLWITYEQLLFGTSIFFFTIRAMVEITAKNPELLDGMISHSYYSDLFITPIDCFLSNVSTSISLHYL